MNVEQLQYFGDGALATLNNPLDLTAEKLVQGIEFEEFECRGVQVSTFPGAKIVINDYDILIGETGKYILPVEEKVKIRSLKVAQETVDYINTHLYSFLTITYILN